MLVSPAGVVLVDTGFGNGKDRGAVPFSHLDTDWLDRLAGLGIGVDDVDAVISTHLHSDHVGWNTRWDGSRWVPTFPRARYYFSKADFVDRTEVPNRPGVSGSFEDSVLPLIGVADVRMVEGRTQVVPGVVIEPIPGHSVGHTVVALAGSDGRTAALLTGDLVHHPIQVAYPAVGMYADSDPFLAQHSRRTVLRRAAEEGLLLLPAHFRAPYAGRVVADGDGLAWRWLDEP